MTASGGTPNTGAPIGVGLVGYGLAGAVLHAPLIEALDGGHGKVQVGDSTWLVSGPDAPTGARVRVIGVHGSVLAVEPLR